MSFFIKPILFGLFGVSAKINDSYKDVNNKGINERFQECLAEDYDEEEASYIDNFVDNTIVPEKMLNKLIPLMEQMLGDPIVINNSVEMRKKIIKFAQRLYEVKSTLLSYQMLFGLAGFDDVTITEYASTSGFDSDITFDDEIRRFDGFDRACYDYTINITGTIGITLPVYDTVLRIIEYLEPINADLRSVLYNGDTFHVQGGIFDETFDQTFV